MTTPKRSKLIHVVQATQELTNDDRVTQSMHILDELRRPSYGPSTRLAAATETLDRIVGRPTQKSLSIDLTFNEIEELKRKFGGRLLSLAWIQDMEEAGIAIDPKAKAESEAYWREATARGEVDPWEVSLQRSREARSQGASRPWLHRGAASLPPST